MRVRLRYALSTLALAFVLGAGIAPAQGMVAPDAAAQKAAPLAGKTICVDPGHGGADPGAVNLAYGLRESAINLDVSYALKAMLEGAGAAVIMTRTDDRGQTEYARAAFCNTPGTDILVSVHTNSVANPDPNGVLTYYGKTSDIALAQAVYDALAPLMRASAPAPAAFIDYGVRRFRAAVLRRTTMPGVLTEPAFLSNPAEAVLLGQSIYTTPGSGKFSPGCADFACRRGRIAQGIFQGILSYFAAPVA